MVGIPPPEMGGGPGICLSPYFFLKGSKDCFRPPKNFMVHCRGLAIACFVNLRYDIFAVNPQKSTV